MARNPQVSSTLDPELYDKIDKLADKESRSISEMVSLLLGQAIKERERQRRKKNATKQGNTEYNSAD